MIGETPNLAARLQALAEPGSVVISRRTRRLHRWPVRPGRPRSQRLKGFAEPLAAFRVEGARPRRKPIRGPARSSGSRRWLGASTSSRMLLERWAWAKDGDGQVVLIAGEPGIGKSRLIRALRERLGDEPYTAVSQLLLPIPYQQRALSGDRPAGAGGAAGPRRPAGRATRQARDGARPLERPAGRGRAPARGSARAAGQRNAIPR